jgi:hypothetical protein
MTSLGFRGPLRYIKCRKVLVPRKDSMIEEASLTFRGQTYSLEENRFSICRMGAGVVDVWHSYSHAYQDGRSHGRWYNTELPATLIQNLEGGTTFRHTMNYEMDDEDENGNTSSSATVTIKFKPAAITKLQGLVGIIGAG